MKVICIDDSAWNVKRFPDSPLKGGVYTVTKSLKKGESFSNGFQSPIDLYELQEFPPGSEIVGRWWISSAFRPLDQATDMQLSETEMAELEHEILKEELVLSDAEMAELEREYQPDSRNNFK